MNSAYKLTSRGLYFFKQTSAFCFHVYSPEEKKIILFTAVRFRWLRAQPQQSSYCRVNKMQKWLDNATRSRRDWERRVAQTNKNGALSRHLGDVNRRAKKQAIGLFHCRGTERKWRSWLDCHRVERRGWVCASGGLGVCTCEWGEAGGRVLSVRGGGIFTTALWLTFPLRASHGSRECPQPEETAEKAQHHHLPPTGAAETFLLPHDDTPRHDGGAPSVNLHRRDRRDEKKKKGMHV